MNSDWAGAQVLVTGASSGIGLASAARFVAGGATVVGVSRRRSPHEGVISVTADLASADWPENLNTAFSAHFEKGRRTVVVHNAATLVSDSLANASAPQLRRVLEVNVVAPLTLSQQLLPYAGAGSALVFVGSTLAEKAVPNTLSYATSKHALIGLMRAATQDLAGTGIHAVAVCPGFTDTEMLAERIPDVGVRQTIGANNGFGRLVTPDEIAAAIEFCAASPVMNGAVVHANLGQLET